MEYDEVIDHTINNIDIGGGNTLSVTLDHLPDPPAIGLEVKCSYITLLKLMFIQEEKWYGEGFGIMVQYIEMRQGCL